MLATKAQCFSFGSVLVEQLKNFRRNSSTISTLRKARKYNNRSEISLEFVEIFFPIIFQTLHRRALDNSVKISKDIEL